MDFHHCVYKDSKTKTLLLKKEVYKWQLLELTGPLIKKLLPVKFVLFSVW